MPLASETKASVCAVVPGEDGGNLCLPKSLKTPTHTSTPITHCSITAQNASTCRTLHFVQPLMTGLFIYLVS
jgi:hypothetical protein